MRKLWLIVGGSTLIYFCLAMLMGVIPGYMLSKTPPGPGVEPLTELQAEGRDVYVSSGCSYCHTQQVRPLDQDKQFGRPSAAGDFAYQTPELLGSERTGPDLSNIGNRQPSEVWQYIHLFDPRAVVPQSIMPNFRWLFDVVLEAPEGVTPVPLPKEFAPADGVVVPSHDAQALIAYLMSLKQPPLPGFDNADTGSTTSTSTAAQPSAPEATSTAAVPSAAPAAGGYVYDAANGKSHFTSTCSACHQASGAGLPSAFPPLKGNPAVGDADPIVHIHTVLFGAHGVVIDGKTYGSPMPPFAGTLSDADIANIINYERSSWGNDSAHVTSDQVAGVRAKGDSK